MQDNEPRNHPKSANQFGENINMITFGESHGLAVGCVIDNVKPGIPISVATIQAELNRRKPGQSKFVTPRVEQDSMQILSGIFEGKTTGTPICLVIYNQDQRSKDYSEIKDVFRPGHADFTFMKKFGFRDYRGGGRSSGRETIARVASGAIAQQILQQNWQIKFRAYVKQIGPWIGQSVDLDFIEKNPLRIADPQLLPQLVPYMEKLIANKDSVGGIVHLTIEGLPVGVGDPVFEKLDGNLAKGLVSIGAVKGVMFGSFNDFFPRIPNGSEVNDQMKDGGFTSNNMGGILGGISSGQSIEVDVYIKPTASVGKKQQTLNTKGENVEIEVKGRHDPCICPRVVPVIENMAALVILDGLLNMKPQASGESDPA